MKSCNYGAIIFPKWPGHVMEIWTQILRQGGASVQGKVYFHHFKVIAQYMWYVCVGGGALKSIANIIPLSMVLAAHAFQTDLPKIQKFAKNCLSHQTEKCPYFSFYISIMLLKVPNMCSNKKCKSITFSWLAYFCRTILSAWLMHFFRQFFWTEVNRLYKLVIFEEARSIWRPDCSHLVPRFLRCIFLTNDSLNKIKRLHKIITSIFGNSSTDFNSIIRTVDRLLT